MKLWFRAKDYGWGWYPAAWQGWLMLGVWFGWIGLLLVAANPETHPVRFATGLLVSIAILILICWKTGERPSWRWAGKPVPWHVVMIKVFVVMGIAFALAAVLAWQSRKNDQERPGMQREVSLFYYNALYDMDAAENIQCSREGLVEVRRTIPTTQTPIQDTIRLLLEGKLTPAERAKGVSTEYPLPGFQLVAASVRDGVLTLTFNDPQNKTGGGSCRVSILWFQIEATAKQFPEIREVRFMPEELFQP